MKYRELIDLGKRLSPFVVGTEGNVSQRTEYGFVIKASGKSLKDIGPDGTVVYCDTDGRSLPDQHGMESVRPSMEVSFHSWIYNNSRYDIIAHTHPVNTVKILCTNLVYEFANVRLFPDQVVFNDAAACVVPYATPGEDLTKSIEGAVLRYGSMPRLFLLANHGIICCADTAEQAAIMTEVCEKAAEVFIGARALGEPVFLNDQQVCDIQVHPDEIYRRKVL